MPSLTQKTILITGATDGLGKSLAYRFAGEGATLLLHGRNPQKGQQTLDAIRSETGNADLYYYNADFASLQQVQAMSQTIRKEHPQLNVLINNAAIGGGPKGSDIREVSKDGYELRFAVNYLAGFVLTQQLLPLLMQSSPSRIVFVSSIGQSPIDFNDMMMEKSYDSYTAYCRSKLAQIIYGFELADQLKDKGVMVNSVHPATLMNTNMVHDFFGKVNSTVEEGTDAVAYVATAPETATVTGTYFNQKRPAKANSQAYNEAARQQLMDISRQLTHRFLA